MITLLIIPANRSNKLTIDTSTSSLLHSDTSLGAVHLTVTDLDRSNRFYADSLGFQVNRQVGNTAFLGAGKGDLLILTEDPDAVQYARRTGLYHFAILVPSRLALAGVLKNLIETETPLQGSADHLVSEALYLADPDGNGIEIYRDRPRAGWQYDNGSIRMATDPLDYQGVLSELENDVGTWPGLPSDTTMGHIHLHVSRLDKASHFYEKVLGFQLMLSWQGQAAFLSAGGYHHHVAVNTWNGVGAAPPPADAVGLRHYTIRLPAEDELARVIQRIESAGVEYEQDDVGIFLSDPARNHINLHVSDQSHG